MLSVSEKSLLVLTIAAAALALALMNSHPALAVALALAAASVGNASCSKIGNARYVQTSPPVFDVGHALLPRVRIPTPAMLCLEWAWVPFFLMQPAGVRWKIATEAAPRFAALMALRAITTNATILPADAQCTEDLEPLWRRLMAGGCYDRIFSGHTAAATLISLSLVKYGVWSASVGWAYTGAVIGAMLLTRGHYTVDVVLGAALAYLVWGYAT